jgi:hypothetical protein
MEKINNTTNESAGITEKRQKSLKGNYQTPEVSKVVLSERPVGDCTDMQSTII